MTVTGEVFRRGDDSANCQAALDWLREKYFGDQAPREKSIDLVEFKGRKRRKTRAISEQFTGYAEAQLTDVGNAERLVARIHDDFRFCPEGTGNRWLRWDGARWAPDTLGAIVQAAKDTTKAMLYDAADSENAKLTHHALRSQKADRLRAMVFLAQSEPGMPVRQAHLDADPWALNVLNAVE